MGMSGTVHLLLSMPPETTVSGRMDESPNLACLPQLIIEPYSLFCLSDIYGKLSVSTGLLAFRSATRANAPWCAGRVRPRAARRRGVCRRIKRGPASRASLRSRQPLPERPLPPPNMTITGCSADPPVAKKAAKARHEPLGLLDVG